MATLKEKNTMAEKIVGMFAAAGLNQADGRHVLSLVGMELNAQAEGEGETSWDGAASGPLEIS